MGLAPKSPNKSHSFRFLLFCVPSFSLEVHCGTTVTYMVLPRCQPTSTLWVSYVVSLKVFSYMQKQFLVTSWLLVT